MVINSVAGGFSKTIAHSKILLLFTAYST